MKVIDAKVAGVLLGLAAAATAAQAERRPAPSELVKRMREEVRPHVDLTTDPARYSVLTCTANYEAHPSTAMLEDGRTIFCFWDLQHGGPCGPAAVSRDAGRTWTRIDERLPKAWTNCYDAPVAFRFTNPKTGRRILRVFAGHYGDRGKDKDRPLTIAMPSILSEDDGETWRFVEPLGVDFTCVISFFGMLQLKDGSYLGAFHRGPEPWGMGSPLEVLLSRSTDGGMTWSKPWPGAKHPDYDLCEPCLFYSPDRSEIGMIIRENRGCGVAQMCFSRDEGRTWTQVQDAPLDLYGERHVVQRLPDGRYFFAFRSQEKKSPHVYGWVGPWEGIRDGSGKGGYRMKLFHNDTYWWDCGYQGVHLAANGEIVVTTYTCLAFKPQCGTPDIESMHFRIADADRLRANPPAEKDPMLGKYHMFGDYTRGSAERPFLKYNKNLDKAFAFLKRKDLRTLPVGTYELGERKGEVFAMVQEAELTPYNSEVEHVEVHAKYIDIQAPLDGEETFGVANVDATRADIGFDAAKDIGFTDVPTGTRTIGPGEFAMFFPGKGGHAPCKSLTGKRRIRKVVIKVLRAR